MNTLPYVDFRITGTAVLAEQDVDYDLAEQKTFAKELEAAMRIWLWRTYKLHTHDDALRVRVKSVGWR